MDSINSAPNDRTDVSRQETTARQQHRLTWEVEMIAEADADITAGLYDDADEIDAWIDSIGTDNAPPPPPTRRR
jgi:predicted transcriptional regulator